MDISNYALTLERSSYEYTGKAIEPKVRVSGLGEGDYTVEYANNVKIGTATVTVKARGDKYKGTITGTFRITKRANTLAASGKKVTVRYKKLKKKAQTLKVSKIVKFSDKGKGTLSYEKVSGNKKITVNKNGKVRVRKGLGKGKYTLKVKISAAGNDTYDEAAETVKIRIKVK